MSAKTEVLIDQLKAACKLTGAVWAAYLHPADQEWISFVSYGLTKTRMKYLSEFLNKSENQKWLDKACHSKRSRYRTVKGFADNLRSEKIYIFPSKSQPSMLIVGVDNLDSKQKKIFEILAMDAPVGGLDVLFEEIPRTAVTGPPEPVFHLGESMQRILEIVSDVIPSQQSFLAIRSGDNFRVEATLNCPPGVKGKDINLGRTKTLEKLVKTRKGAIFSKREADLDIPLGEWGKEKNWLINPLLIKTRVIGFIAHSHIKTYSHEDLSKAIMLSHHISPAIEKTIVFVEAANYLQRFALLNEIAAAASTGLDVDEVSQRIKRMLERAFKASRVSLLLIDPNDKELLEYQGNGKLPIRHSYQAESTIESTVIKIGNPLRINNIQKQSKYSSQDENILSKIVVPLRSRGKIIGVLSLEDQEPDSFSERDENLLVVIASQVANIIENVRLNEETRLRAENLFRINDILQSVLGLNEVSTIANVAASIMADRFGYEMVLIMIHDEEMGELVAEGVAGSHTEDVPKGFRYARNLGIPGEVLKYGKSVLFPRAADAPNYFPIPGWEPGSVMCVPLRDGEEVFGVINVEYQVSDAVNENDLLVLEAIAGVLSSAIISASHYQQLNTSIRRLEAVRETAIDLGTDLDLEILMRRVVNRVRELVDARGAELGLVEKNQKAVRVLVSENPWQDYTGYTFPFMSGVTGHVAALGEPLAIADFNSWSGKGASGHKAPFTTVAGVPLTLSGQVIGTLTVQDDRPIRAFNNEDIITLELLAPQISVFIRNAQLYQDLEKGLEAQRVAEERLVQTAKMAAIGEMAAAIAHELNNPLTTVTGFTELILETLPKDSPEYEDLSLVLKEAQRSRMVVRRLLDFSRQGDILRVDTDANEIISTVLALVHHLAQTSGVETRTEIWDALPLIRVDRNQIQQVLLNLIHNAIQAMPDGGELVIQSLFDEQEGENWIAIKVSDTGKGISEENLEKIFEPFFTTKPTGEGTGLGLSVSYNIIVEHGGYITVESQEGQGTVFTVWLPVSPSSTKESEG